MVLKYKNVCKEYWAQEFYGLGDGDGDGERWGKGRGPVLRQLR